MEEKNVKEIITARVENELLPTIRIIDDDDRSNDNAKNKEKRDEIISFIQRFAEEYPELSPKEIGKIVIDTIKSTIKWNNQFVTKKEPTRYLDNIELSEFEK